MPTKNIRLPDIGDFETVEVVEILVKVGDKINKEDSIITLESDKASMEIPSSLTGIVTKINVVLGDKIKQDDIILNVFYENKDIPQTKEQPVGNNSKTTKIIDILVPNIDDFDKVEVIEVLVKVGDAINKEDSIITIESDKASMEIPSPNSGKVIDLQVSIGDKVGFNDLILKLQTTNTTKDAVKEKTTKTTITQTIPNLHGETINSPNPILTDTTTEDNKTIDTKLHASPSVRKLARELGVDLLQVSGSGKKNNILSVDLKMHIKKTMAAKHEQGTIAKIPIIDFSKFGKIEYRKLSRIDKLSGKHLSACWLNVPHVTQFDEVNIESLEQFRQSQKTKGIKLTLLVFIMKAVVKILAKYPRFNSSLSADNETLILKKYFNLGIAIDTANGLVVPVVHQVDKKSLKELAAELATTSKNARAGRLTPSDMQGGGFTISSLGGIGGTQFSPIVNAPEVAILGVSRSRIKPIWNGKNFTPALTLPLALSYDHRVIDGAQGARFMVSLNGILMDIREILL